MYPARFSDTSGIHRTDSAGVLLQQTPRRLFLCQRSASAMAVSPRPGEQHVNKKPTQ
jgi:hypothetical protein